MLLPCPHCHTLNRLPEERLAEQPVCGRCKQPLFTGQPLELNASTLALHLERGELPLLVDFWAPWCGPCRMMAPAFAQAATHLEPALRLGKVNTEALPELGARYAIRSIPTLVLFQGGKELARQSGALSETQIIQWVRSQHR
ncbi:thioredoxin TrxC [Azovibrio restrictus]|uniref:thioredoxin TrxC n=1 Tax=Azovibrio restrictus TaxID=146938 RepID=UPI0026F192C2|nr:thioredoxin TrxC [Azovibrio restrictus]MDD3482026.1 thioredoxin TrxC [Azovibrio restrictus]